MGHSQAEKAATHERIVAIASKRFREVGFDGIGVADLMKEAGLTVGGFYKHFGSRDDLVAEAFETACVRWNPEAQDDAPGARRKAVAGVIDRYLSPDHRDQPGTGCVIGALVGDVARSGERTRALFTGQVRRNIETLSELGENKTPDAARAQAILTLSAMVGAVGLARAVSDEDLSEEILKTVHRLLLPPEAPQID